MPRNLNTMIKSRNLLLLFLFAPFLGLAQILDDSTRVIYGPISTGFLYERDVLNDDTTLHHPDTLIDGFRLMTINRQTGWLWQDLGNEGSSAKPMVFRTPENAFTEVGLTAFSALYAPKIEDIKYYNTRSPFTNMAYTQNTNGMTNLGFTHAQNINPGWNFGLNVNRIASSKQYSSTTSEDRLVDHWDYTFNTNYLTKNKKYRILASLVHFNHKQLEQGGIKVFEGSTVIPPSEIRADYNTNYQQVLNGVNTRERWNDLHLYHQLKLAKGIEVFHVFDYQRHKYFHSDTLIDTNLTYAIYSDSAASDKMKNYYFFNNIQNRFGFKGSFKGFKYTAGLTNRIYSYNAVHEGETGNTKTEILVGGNAGYWFSDSLSYLDNEVYFGVGNSLNIYLKSNLRIKNIDLGFQFITKPPYLFYNNFSSVLIDWSNSFGNVTYTSADAKIRIGTQKAWFEPSTHINLVSNHLYFDQTALPRQLSSEAFLFDIGINAGVKMKNWKLTNQFIYNGVSNKEVFRLPAIINNTNIEYHVLYAKVLDLYFGTDIYFRSSFMGDAYSPMLASFYLQDNQNVWGYPVADVYTNFMIKRVKLAFAFNYLNKGLGTQGFYTSPGYLAMGRTFSLKVNWPLFD